MSNEGPSLVNFNELQQQLADTLNPNAAKQQTKEIFANLLLGMGVPFFTERLRSKIPEDAMKKITELLKDPDNLGKNAMEFAKQVFKDKFLEPVKNALLDKASEFIPELKDIDLGTASLTDIQNALSKGIITKMKAKLPPEIADALPENFTRDDILTAVKGLAQDKALQFAKDNLPPEAYAELERNQDILTDPAKISDFVQGKLTDVENSVKENFTAVKNQVQARFDEVKTAIKGKIDEATQGFNDKLDELKTARDTAKSNWKDLKSQFSDRFDGAKAKLEKFKADNPMHTADDLLPYENEIAEIKQNVKLARDNYLSNDGDFASQIEGVQTQIDDVTTALVNKVANVRAVIGQKVQQIAEKSQDVADQVAKVPAAVQEKTAEITQQVERRTAQVEQKATTMFRGGEEATQEAEGFFSRAKTFFEPVATKFNEVIGKLRRPPPNTATGGTDYEGYGNIQMEQPDAPETEFTTETMDKIMVRPSMATYYGSELDDPASLISLEGNRARVGGYKATPRNQRVRKTATEKQQEKPAPVEEEPAPAQIAPKPVQAQGVPGETATGQQEANAFMERQAQLEAQRQQQAKPSEIEPVPEEQPAAPAPAPAQPQIVEQGAPVNVEQEAPKATTATPPQTAPASGQAPAPSSAATAGTGETEEQIAAKAAEGAVEKTATGEAVEGGLIAGFEAVPVLDVLVDIGGILGSIFGAKSLMGGSKPPPPPVVSGETYEPNL